MFRQLLPQTTSGLSRPRNRLLATMNAFPTSVRIVDVGPRDGLQNEPNLIPTVVKIRLIDMLSDAGLKAIESTSFVSPKWVPQMADNTAVLKGIRQVNGVQYPVLVPNMFGLEQAIDAGAKQIAVFASASESFSRKNINCSISESFERFEPVIKKALDNGLKVRGYVSCVIGCPYEGPIASQAVAQVARRLHDLGCYEISLGDTIGIGTPGSVGPMLTAVLSHISVDSIAVHFHDTYGQALANIFNALSFGVSVVDSALAGLGGCPYAKGATGNVATEDVVYMLHGMGIATGIDMEKLLDASDYISKHLNRPPESRVARALLAARQRPIPSPSSITNP